MDDQTKRYRLLAVCVSLAITTLVVYWQVRSHDFIDFDDDHYVTKNEDVQAGLTWQGVKWAFAATHAWNWHPLTWLSHMLDCELYGLNPAGHHLTSVMFHIANTLLLFLVFRHMTGHFWRSTFIAGLFALHPLHVESVAWVSERKDVLSSLFWLLTMWFYIRYAERLRFAAYLPVVVSLGLGLMAKQMLVTLPFILLLLDYWPLQRFPRPSQKKRERKARFAPASLAQCFMEKVPLLVLSAIGSLIIYLIQDKVALVKSATLIPTHYRLGNALVSYARYTVKMFYPLNLGILYPHPERNLRLWHVLVAVCLLLTITAVAIRLRRSRRWLFVGWFWYLGTLVPVIGLVQVGLQAMADRYTYVPLIGLSVVVTYGAAEILEKQKFRNVALATAAAIVLSALSTLTFLQLRHWKNSITLYEHTVAVTKDNDVLHYNLGQLFLAQDRTDDAIEHFREAVRIRPEQHTIHNNLGILLTRQGKIDLAIYHFQQVLKYRPDDAAVQQALRDLLARRNKSPTRKTGETPP